MNWKMNGRVKQCWQDCIGEGRGIQLWPRMLGRRRLYKMSCKAMVWEVWGGILNVDLILLVGMTIGFWCTVIFIVRCFLWVLWIFFTCFWVLESVWSQDFGLDSSQKEVTYFGISNLRRTNPPRQTPVHQDRTHLWPTTKQELQTISQILGDPTSEKNRWMETLRKCLVCRFNILHGDSIVLVKTKAYTGITGSNSTHK